MDMMVEEMRVLAVDDNPICLKVLDSLLRKCNYHVTSTNRAADALRLLQESRNKYDLVISDVNMPDIDGFKLLELVGLQMDLPVIMLSAHSDKDLVYKGVTRGAVDYLLKPVRIEELKNIWQHVVRRKKQHSSRSSKSNRKCKDQNEEEEEAVDFDENEESGSQKKPRVVWLADLHSKFVTAVNQLGLDKAVPKKILDLMNVEGLTRENVASHLQKYRQHLKRQSSEASEKQDSSFLKMASPDGFGDFHSMSSSGRLANTSVPSSMPGRLNSPSCLTLRGITSSGLLHPQKASNSFNSPLSHNSNVFQGKSTYGPMILQQYQTRVAFGIQSSLSEPGFQTNLVPLRQNVLTMGNVSNELASSSVVSGDFQGLISNSEKHRVEPTNNVDACVFQNTQDDNYDSLDDLMNAMIKRQDKNGTFLMDGEFEFDGCSLGFCF